MEPFPDRAKGKLCLQYDVLDYGLILEDYVTHKMYWQRSGFKVSYS